MSDTVEQLGPILGLLAFVGLIVLAFLIFAQARELRRLRDWAGRAPERASEAADASLAAQEARGGAPTTEPQAGALTRARTRVGGTVGGGYRSLDSKLPFDARILLGILAALLIAVIVVTSGFGLIGGDGDDSGEAAAGAEGEPATQVAVLNATQTTDSTGQTVPAVAGLAKEVSRRFVNPPAFRSTVQTDAPAGLPDTVVMFDRPGDEAAADELAADVEEDFDTTEVVSMTQEVRDVADGAPIALVVGSDDAGLITDSSSQ